MNPPLHVLMVAPRALPEIGGLETHVAELVDGLLSRGHRVTLATQAPRRVVAEAGRRVERDRLVVHRFPLVVPAIPDVPSPALLAALPGLARQADVVHAHGYHALPALGAVFSSGTTPCVLTLHYHGTGHSPLRARLHTLYRPLGAAMVGRAAALVAVSQAEHDLLEAHFGAAGSRAVVIPNGVRVAEAAEAYEAHGPVVLTVGRLERYKRVDLLVRAMAHLPAHARLVVAGDGPARGELASLAQSVGLAERVRLLGRVSDSELHRWRATATVFATASARESFGITFAEALASGIPSVASDLPSHREIAALAAHARVVPGPVADGPGLADDAALAARFAAEMRPLLTGARPAIPSEHGLWTWPRTVAAVEEVYRGVLRPRDA